MKASGKTPAGSLLNTLALTAIMMASSCAVDEGAGEMTGFSIPLEIVTKGTVVPPEDNINDINVFVFSEDGLIEESFYLSSRQLEHSGDTVRTSVTVACGTESRIAVCANFGYRVTGIGNLRELAEYRFPLAYPDEISKGIPCSGISEGVIEPKKKLKVELERMMAKIKVKIDRRALDNDVNVRFTSARVCNSPHSATVFGDSFARHRGDVFSSGYILSGRETDPLNSDWHSGISEDVTLYLLENLQGDLLPENTDEHGKVLSGLEADRCSYIELQAEYISSARHTPAGNHIYYRFYPGASPRNFDIRRNTVYSYTVVLSGSGLDAPDWLLDISGLADR